MGSSVQQGAIENFSTNGLCNFHSGAVEGLQDEKFGFSVLITCQIIFAGKTVRCHVNGGKPGFAYSNAESHWPTPDTMKDCVIAKILGPWRKAVILKLREEGIPIDDNAEALAIVAFHLALREVRP